MPAPPETVVAGWAVSGRRSDAALTLTDCTPLAKVGVRVTTGGGSAELLGAVFGRAVRHSPAGEDPGEVLVAGVAPDEWLLLCLPGTARALVAQAEDAAPREAVLVTVLDVTHGRALLQLTGSASEDLLAAECGADLTDPMFPDGAVARFGVAGVVAELIRADRDGVRSYLVGCERSYGQYLFDALRGSGREHGLAVDGFRLPL